MLVADTPYVGGGHSRMLVADTPYVGGAHAVCVRNSAGEGGAGRKPRMFVKCPHCKKTVIHTANDCYKLEKNKEKRFEGWKSCL